MHEVDLPKVSFGIIVLNGEPLNRHSHQVSYRFAREIIV